MPLTLRKTWRGRLPTLVVALACLLAAGCSRQALLDKVSSPEDRALGAQIIQAVQTGDDGVITPSLDPDLREKIPPLYPAMRALTPAGPDAKVTLVDARFTQMTSLAGGATRDSLLTYGVDGASRHVMVRIAIRRQGPTATITGLYIQPLTVPANQVGALTLKGKSAVQLLFLALAILSPLTIVAGLVALFATKGIRRKWLWTLGCLLGVGQFAVDWASGAVSFQPLYVQLFGGFAIKSGMLEPWRVGFGVPVVALIILIFRHRIAAHDAATKKAGRPDQSPDTSHG